MYYKKLTGKKCYLSPINQDDYQKYTEWLNDLEVLEYLSIASYNIHEAAEKETLLRLSKDHNYAIVECGTDKLLGNCGLMDLDNVNRTAELGIFIGNKEFWNKGYGTEAMQLLLTYGFKFLNLNNVQLRVYGFNTRAIKAYEKIGFKLIGTRRKALERNHVQHDIVYMDILPEELIPIQ